MQQSVASFFKRKGRTAAALALAISMLWLLLTQMAAPTQGAGPDLPARHPHLESALRDLVAAHRAGDASAATAFATQHGVSLADGLVKVIVVSEGEATQAAIARQIAALGGRVGATSGPWTQARLPVEALPALADASGVHFVRRPWLPLPVTVSQGVTVTYANQGHVAGLTGWGVTISVLDLGFLGYTNRIAEGELPADVITRSFVGVGSERDFWGYPADSHGAACAEIVHDMAPDAGLYLVNFSDEVEWANAVDWLVAQGVDVISFSAGWPVGGPGDGSGYLAQKVSAVRAAGVLWVNAAGNSARRHWMGLWDDPDADGWHNYVGTDETNEITVTVGGDSRIVVGLRWNDAWGSSANDYDLFLFGDGPMEPVVSDNVQDGDDDPWEFIDYTALKPGVYRLAISRQPGAQRRTLELFSYSHDLHYQTTASSLLVPADSPGSLTVGATYWQDNALQDFSSQGPTRDGRTKPDLAAPDGVSVRTEAWRDGGFYGTSAAAPHVAGAAALVWEYAPAYTPAQIQSWLQARAVDMGKKGKDNAYGAGRLNLQMTVAPSAALQGTTATLAVLSFPFRPTATFYLTRSGYGNILPGNVTWVSDAKLTGTVSLSSAAPGLWTAVITNPPSNPITLSNAFLVAVDQVRLPLITKNVQP